MIISGFDALGARRALVAPGIEPAQAEALARELRGAATSTVDAHTARRKLVDAGLEPAHAGAVTDELIAAAATRARDIRCRAGRGGDPRLARRRGVGQRRPAHRAWHGAASARGLGVEAPRVARERLPGALPRRRTVPRHLVAPHAAAMSRVRERGPRRPLQRRALHGRNRRRSGRTRSRGGMRLPALRGRAAGRLRFPQRAGGEAFAGAARIPSGARSSRLRRRGSGPRPRPFASH